MYTVPISVSDEEAPVIPIKGVKMCDCGQPLYHVEDGIYVTPVEGQEEEDGAVICPNCGKEWRIDDETD